MSTTSTQSDSGEPATTDYRIDLTDIRGVGEKTADHLREANITSVEEVHLLRKRSGAAYQTLLSRGVGSETMTHLRAVGKAVHYSGNNRVEAKHLTHPVANNAQFSSSLIDITAEASPTGDTGANGKQQALDNIEQHDPDDDELAAAVEEIQDAYGEGHNEQNRFQGDLARFVGESDRFDSDDNLPLGLVQSLLRYRHDADRFSKQMDYEDRHGSLLIAFADNI